MMLGQNPNHEEPNEEISPDGGMLCYQAATILAELRIQESLELIRENLIESVIGMTTN